MGNIESPLRRESAGTFGRQRYVRDRGRFAGETSQGPFSVPYEITAPSTPAGGNTRFLVEVPHFNDGVIARVTIPGDEILFGNSL
jgi:hypothetical protein